MNILTKSLNDAKKVFGISTKIFLLTLLVLIICTCSGPRLMLGTQTFEKQTVSFSYSGPPVWQTHGVMVCPISRTDVQAFRSWHQVNALIWRPYQPTHVLGFCPNLAPMLRRCSLIRSYQYPLIIPSFSNRSRTVWTAQRPSLPTESQPANLPEEVLSLPTKPKPLQGWTPRSTGKTPVIMPTMVRSSGSSSMMNRGSGKSPTTSSTTGVLRKPPLD